MPRNLKMTTNDLERIKGELQRVPPPAVRLTASEALRRLAPDLAKMKANGHTVDSIATTLSASGLEVTARAVARALTAATPKRRRSAGPGAAKGQAADAPASGESRHTC